MFELHAIHGFLGLPDDWNFLNFKSNLFPYDLAKISSEGLWDWAKRFNRLSKPNSGILIGYSLGGRLAMHALLESPDQWVGGIIISSHTGFKSEQEKAARLSIDAAWADRFENEPWENVLRDWNAQAVFGGKDFPIERKEKQFSRKNLGYLLRQYSRGRQDDLSTALQNLQKPILWIGGQLDSVFLEGTKNLTFAHPLSRVESVEGAAHRVPWEQPKKFLNSIQSFMNEVSSCL